MKQELLSLRCAAAKFAPVLLILCVLAFMPHRASAAIDKIECCEKTFQPNPEYISVYVGSKIESYEFKITGTFIDLAKAHNNAEIPVTGGKGVKAIMGTRQGGLGSYITLRVEVLPEAPINTTFTIRIELPAGVDEFRIRTSPASFLTKVSATPEVGNQPYLGGNGKLASIHAVGDTCIITLTGSTLDEIVPNMSHDFFRNGGSIREISRSATQLQFAITSSMPNTGFTFDPAGEKENVGQPIFVRRNLHECMQPHAFMDGKNVVFVTFTGHRLHHRWEYPDLSVGATVVNNQLILNKIANTYITENSQVCGATSWHTIDSATNTALCALMEQPTTQKPVVEQIIRIPDLEFRVRNRNNALITQPFVVLVQSEGRTLHTIIVDQNIPANSSIIVRCNRSDKLQLYGNNTTATGNSSSITRLQPNTPRVENLLSPETKKKLQRNFNCPYAIELSPQPQGMDWQDPANMTIVVNPPASMISSTAPAIPKRIPETDLNNNIANFRFGNPSP